MGVPSVWPSKTPDRIRQRSVSLRVVHDLALAGPAPVELTLDIFFAQLEKRRTAIDDYAHAAAVGFAPGRDAEELSEAAAHFTTLTSRPPK